MHVIGVRHARNTGRRGASVIRAGGWQRVARELVLVAVFLAVYEEIRWHMVQAG